MIDLSVSQKPWRENLQKLLLEVVEKVKAGEKVTDLDLLRLQRKYALGKEAAQPFYLKSEILAIFAQEKAALLASKKITTKIAKELEKLLQVKPVRTQSGVATVTVLTKPWPCPGQCIFCPSEARMPKSYLANEPGAQRAEHNYFDPFLQVTSRLQNLKNMGHDLSKVELIVLGGTWDNYPLAYRIWFIKRMFEALNNFGKNEKEIQEITAFYEEVNRQLKEKNILTLTNKAAENEKNWAEWQDKLDRQEISYNQMVKECYVDNEREKLWSVKQQATWIELEKAQNLNVTSKQRNVGLVIETRPDVITVKSLTDLRHCGCTKVQIGIQSINDEVLMLNHRGVTRAQNARAIGLLRLFGFKIHAHFMANLYGSTPEKDVSDYTEFVTTAHFLPDEVKIYPCSLIKSAQLMNYYRDGRWQPYSEATLLDVLTKYLLITPAYVRVTRMIRDISSADIVVGNRKTNFRQLVEDNCGKLGDEIKEIRHREVRHDQIDLREFKLAEIEYQTKVSTEYFLQYVNEKNRIIGFLRLSLPKIPAELNDLALPEGLGEAAMIREIHVYGVATALQQKGDYQHAGFGKKLVERAKEIARAANYKTLKVISAVGTREYYEKKLGFFTSGLYQEIEL